MSPVSRGFGGPAGAPGWATMDEHTGATSWQQFERDPVIVLKSGAGYILYDVLR